MIARGWRFSEWLISMMSDSDIYQIDSNAQDKQNLVRNMFL